MHDLIKYAAIGLGVIAIGPIVLLLGIQAALVIFWNIIH